MNNKVQLFTSQQINIFDPTGMILYNAMCAGGEYSF